MSDQPPIGFFVSTDKSLLDFGWITKTVLGTYFAFGRKRADFEAASVHSLCFGLYKYSGGIAGGCPQVGFARVITDHAMIGWLCDVVIDPEYRHRKLGHFLMHQIVHDPSMRGISLILATQDAHSFYRDFGFVDEGMMVRRAAPR